LMAAAARRAVSSNGTGLSALPCGSGGRSQEGTTIRHVETPAEFREPRP